ncbi:MAG: transposase [Terracidiphilus sp.]
MGYIQGEARGQQTLFPVALDDLIPGDHFGRVIDAFVDRLELYLYGYLQQVRSSRRLEGVDDAVLERIKQRATAAVMRLRRCTVEHPFGTLKYRIFGNPRLLLRGLGGAQTEISLGTMAYNLKRMINALGGLKLVEALEG